MKNNDLVSIIIPIYNSTNYLEDTLKSVVNQTYKNYEAILIDDGSTDNSMKIAYKFAEKNKKIKIIKVEHQGVSNARNIGIKSANGRYLTFLDSDDVWLPNKLEEQIKFIKENNYEFVYCNFIYMSDNGKKFSKEIKTGNMLNYKKALKDIRILTITAMIDLERIPKELCYMPNTMDEDIATWWKILRNGYVAHGQDKVLAFYRKTKNSRSSKKYITAYYRWKLYRQNENLSLLISINCFIQYVINALKKRANKIKFTKEEMQKEMEKRHLIEIYKEIEKQYSIEKNKIQVAISTQNLTNDEEVHNLLKSMNLKTDYIIVNQTNKENISIENKRVITKNEKGLSKSRNTAIEKSTENIILLADDDITYENNYEKIVKNAWDKYKKADIICFYVESKNSKRKTKRMNTGKIGYIKAMRIVSTEISLKKDSIKKVNLKFLEEYGAGAKYNRGEEQIFLYEAIRKGLKIIFVNKKIGEVKQEESNWFTRYNLEYFNIQGEVFKKMSPKYYRILIFQYAIRKYHLYYKEISFKKAIYGMLGRC